MAEALTLQLTLTADGKGLVGEVRASEQEIKKLTKGLKDTEAAGGKATRGMDKTGASAGKAKRELRDMAQNTQGLTSALSALPGPAGNVAARLHAISSGGTLARRTLIGVTAAVGASLAVIHKANGIYGESERQLFRLEAQTKATGFAAGFSGAQLDEFARNIARNTLASTAGVRDAIGILLTFKQVTGDSFKRAIAISQDLAAVMGTDIRSAALQLGKALEDPKTGLTALTRSGVSFTEQEKKVIQSLVETGRQGEAMSQILDKVSGQLGPAGQAEARGYAGAIDTLGQEYTELMEALSQTGTAIKLVNGLSAALARLRGLIAPSGQEQFDALIQQREELRQKLQTADNSFVASLAGFNQDDLTRRLGEVNAEIKRLSDERIRQQQQEGAQLQEAQRKNQELAAAAASERLGKLRQEQAALQSVLRATSVEGEAKINAERLAQFEAALNHQFATGQIGYVQYYSAVADIQREALASQQTVLQAQLSSLGSTVQDQAKRLSLNADIEVLALQQVGVAEEASRSIFVAEQKAAELRLETEQRLADSVTAVHVRLLESQGQIVEARRLQLESEFGELVASLHAAGDSAGAGLVQRLVNNELVRAELEKMQAQVDTTLGQLANRERSLELDQSSGLLTELQTRQRLLELRKATADEIALLIPRMQELAQASGDPAAIAAVEELKLKYQELGVVVNETTTRIQGVVQDGLANSLQDFITGSATAEEAFQGFVQSVLAGIAQIIAQKLAQLAVETALFAVTGGGSAAAGGGTTKLGLFHTGGMVGEHGRPMRAVAPSALLNAPRMHSGGVAGLRRDEVPIIAQRGEEVLTREDPRHRFNQGGGQQGMQINLYGITDAQTFIKSGAQIEREYVARVNRGGRRFS